MELADQRRFREAIEPAAQSLAISKELLGENHPEYAGDLNNLAMMYFEAGDAPKAEPLCRKALTIRKRVLGEERLEYTNSLELLAAIQQGRGDFNGAERSSARTSRSAEGWWVRIIPFMQTAWTTWGSFTSRQLIMYGPSRFSSKRLQSAKKLWERAIPTVREASSTSAGSGARCMTLRERSRCYNRL